MKITYRPLLALCALSLSLVSTEPARAIGDAARCLVTVKKVFLKNAAGDWILLMNQDHVLDLSKEDQKISVVNKKLIPTGIYTNCKLVISETFQVEGSDGPNLTKEGGEVWVEGTAAKLSDLPGKITMLREDSPTWNTEKEGMITVHLNLDYSDSDDIQEIYGKKNFLKPLKVKEGSRIQIIPAIFFSRTIRYVWAGFWETFPKNDTMYFLPPGRVEELSVKVDGITALMTNDIEWTF